MKITVNKRIEFGGHAVEKTVTVEDVPFTNQPQFAKEQTEFIALHVNFLLDTLEHRVDERAQSTQAA